jgi:hypothetical protein
MQYKLLNRGQKIFFTMWGIWVSKKAELNVDFKKINLYKRQNAPKKSKSRIKILFTTQGPILLDGLAHISAMFLLKMQKKYKIGSP